MNQKNSSQRAAIAVENPAHNSESTSIPLSFTQERYWLLSLVECDSEAYHNTFTITITGALDKKILDSALSTLAHRHSALGAYYESSPESCVQHIKSTSSLTLASISMDDVNDPAHDKKIQSFIYEHHKKIFTLSETPLIRLTLIATSSTIHILVITAHRIIADKQSLAIIASDISRCYTALLNKKAIPSVTSPHGYQDQIASQYRESMAPSWADHKAFWMKQFVLPLPILQLYSETARPARATYSAAETSLDISSMLVAQAESCAQSVGASLLDFFMAVFAITLFRHTGHSDIMLGVAQTGRKTAEAHSLVGCYATMLPQRVDVSNHPSFKKLLKAVHETYATSLEHDVFSLEKIIAALSLPPDPSRHPLFQAALTFDTFLEDDLHFGSSGAYTQHFPDATILFDISLLLTYTNKSLRGTIRYNSTLFSQAFMSCFAEHFLALCNQLNKLPDDPLDTIPFLSEREVHTLTTLRNPLNSELSSKLPVHQWFELTAERTPTAIALVFGDHIIPYEDLNKRANQLAHYLIAFGVQSNAKVALCLPRSIELIIGMLGILKASATYVPIDPAYPLERQEFMITDAHAVLIVSDKAFSGSTPHLDIVNHAQLFNTFDDSNPSVPLQEDQLIYMIYTSGSTGKPKGSGVYHTGFSNLIAWYTSLCHCTPNSKFLIISSLSFDLTQKNIFAPLVSGGTLVLLDTPHYDPSRIRNLILTHGITGINCTPSAFYALVDNTQESDLKKMLSLTSIFLGGESIIASRLRPFIATPGFKAQFVNSYGPTECTDVCAYYCLLFPADFDATTIPLGQTVPNTRMYVLDENRALVPDGTPGELYIGGIGVGSGYHNRDELTHEKFVPDPFFIDAHARMYKSGDRVCYRSDGLLDFLGRADRQVKVNGFRIELDEINAALQKQSGVKDSVITTTTSPLGEHELIAYVVAQAPMPTEATLRTALSVQLPTFMIPSLWVFLDTLPLSPNGKVDINTLPAPHKESKPKTFSQTNLSSDPLISLIRLTWKEVLSAETISDTDRFFDCGGTSLKAIQCVSRISKELGISIPVVSFFSAPTIAHFSALLKTTYPDALASRFQTNSRASSCSSTDQIPIAASGTKSESDTNHSEAIAIIGMSLRYPGADTIDEFWHNLRNGVESIRSLSDQELIDKGVSRNEFSNPSYVKACAFMRDVEMFDAAFFGINPREAQLMDPQQRILLECAWSALEHAGYPPHNDAQNIGVFAGVARDAYLTSAFAAHSDLLKSAGEYTMMIGNEKDFPATRVAYKLNLTGPALTVQTACSSSGVGIHYAVHSLRARECSMALVGGSRMLIPHDVGYTHVDGGTLSPDGHVRAFDEKAAGMVRGNGAGFILLKRLSDAVADGDTVYATILSTAVNNDGNAKVGFTAPSVPGQAAVITAALHKAGISAETITSIEAHGTGTALGDPIEVAALTQAFSAHTAKKGYCALGSVKTNIGHLDAGSCVAGVIKTVLSLYHKELFPSLHYTAPNPQINFLESPFFVNTKLTPWESPNASRRAGVSSFGLGGTNVHLILEEAPCAAETKTTRALQVFPLSAKSPLGLDISIQALARHMHAHPEIPLSDNAHTLQIGRTPFAYRSVFVANTHESAREGFQTKKISATLAKPFSAGSVAFMFPGQGSQHPFMAHELYTSEFVFKNTVDEACDILKPLLDLDLRDYLYPKDLNAEDYSKKLNQTGLAQPALFTIQYALAKLFESFGIIPDCLIGHSVGEYVAACYAGVFSLKDALTVLAHRARLMQSMPGGAMRAIRLSHDALMPYLGNGVTLAASNAPGMCIVSGSYVAIAEFEKKCTQEKIEVLVVHTSHAFHSPMMYPMLEPFKKIVASVERKKPQIPIMSTWSASPLTTEMATSVDYWASQLAEPVRFSEAFTSLTTQKDLIFIECGPGTILSNAAKQHLSKDEGFRIINAQPHAAEKASSAATFFLALGRAWICGISPDWASLHNHEPRKRVGLPTYPFERKRFWIDPPVSLPVINEPILTMPPDLEFINEKDTAMPSAAGSQAQPRLSRILAKLSDIINGLAGIELSENDYPQSFLELGLDSLLLTQAATKIQNDCGVAIKFRQLVDELSSPLLVAGYLDEHLPPDALPAQVQSRAQPIQQTGTAQRLAPSNVLSTLTSSLSASSTTTSEVAALIAEQLKLMSQQLEILTSVSASQPVSSSVAASPPTINVSVPPVAKSEQTTSLPIPESDEQKKFVGPALRINKSAQDSLSPKQKRHLEDLITRYTKKTASSKEFTKKHRPHLADPRAVSGFRPLLKEAIYPIVVNKSEGSKLWDIDNNEYIDITNGFGSNFFGHRAPFVIEALKMQLDEGIEIGPQHPLAGKLSEKLSAFLGHERVAFCNTGSEAVLGAMRIARTVTGRNLIVMFVGAYHGIFDEVIVRGTKKLKSLPAAPGIQPGAVENILVLDYGTPETLEIIRSKANELAAILVEPVQSRLPEFQPVAFLKELRTLTKQSGTVLIFDEVVTGFRAAQRGAQEIFDIKADIATYGKVLGGGMNIGVIAGAPQFLDALDGGAWNYGDDSIPEVGVTYFAGTFVRHPPALVAAHAVIDYLIAQGPSLQKNINDKTSAFVKKLNDFCAKVGAPIIVTNFATVVRIAYTTEVAYGELLYMHMREKGVHVWDHRPVYLTVAHTDADFEFVLEAFKQSVKALQAGDFLPSIQSNSYSLDANQPPLEGARLGRDQDGNPAWFIPDPTRPGKFIQLENKA